MYRCRIVPMLVPMLLLGCQKPNAAQTARQEEAYTPPAAPAESSLDRMDAAGTGERYPADSSGGYDAAADSSYAYNTTSGGTTAAPADEPLTPSTGGRTYVVQRGDTLYSIARRFYQDQSRWRDIWTANQTRVPDPNRLEVGTKLIIP